MVGDKVLYHFRNEQDRLGFITKEHEDGTVDLFVCGSPQDFTWPLQNHVGTFPNVKAGNMNGEFTLIDKPPLIVANIDVPPSVTSVVPKLWFNMNAEERRAYQEQKNAGAQLK